MIGSSVSVARTTREIAEPRLSMTNNYIDNLKSFDGEGTAGWSLSMIDSQRFSV
jgi:hypothetical protein